MFRKFGINLNTITLNIFYQNFFMKTKSENIVTRVNENIFYKEFTFDKNNFVSNDGDTKELADNILWLDDLLFIIQIKERNLHEVKSKEDENNWFKNKVLGKAKSQIYQSLKFFQDNKKINIKNIRGHLLDISKVNLGRVKKIIIYMPNSFLIGEENKSIKFYKSKKSGSINIFNIDDYSNICKKLITPTELNEYLEFRERFCLKHGESYSEEYMLAHFLNTDDESEINKNHTEIFNKLLEDFEDFDVSSIIIPFSNKMLPRQNSRPVDYHLILKEIAKLKRYELLEFKKRYKQIINDVALSQFRLPYRFTSTRIDCGFVFIPLDNRHEACAENYLLNHTELYKYKRKLNKCLGVLVYKIGEYFDIKWALFHENWVYNKIMEDDLKKESKFCGEVITLPLHRYKINSDS